MLALVKLLLKAPACARQHHVKSIDLLLKHRALIDQLTLSVSKQTLESPDFLLSAVELDPCLRELSLQVTRLLAACRAQIL